MYQQEYHGGTSTFRQPTSDKPALSWRNWLIGNPLSTADAPHQTIGKMVGLAVFASDALSSTAYATQEMMFILAFAGAAAFSNAIPLSFAIVTLLAILTLSYEQTIHAYPDGGGAYIVSRDNLGKLPALVAAAALLTDYILTVAVSVSSAVAQIASAYPDFYPFRVIVAVLIVTFIMTINLRGVKESGTIFAIPTYFFVFSMVVTVLVGFVRYLTGGLGVVVNPPETELMQVAQPLTFFLILRAFSNGTSAVTGVEAISNGITAFKEPRSRNAGVTLIWMSVILGVLMLGITFLSVQIAAIPSEFETVVSQLARTVFGGRGVIYYLVISAITVILGMAANTAFADFPRLSALVARDGYLPRQFNFKGSRLVYSSGIIALAVIASLLIVLFQASVNNLIPLYAIGVFLSFTLSQAGMAIRWRKVGGLKPGEKIVEPGSTLEHERGWQIKMVVNGLGSVTTLVVMIVFGATKFRDGAWIVMLLIPLLVMMFLSIRRHYLGVARALSLENYGSPPRSPRRRVILPIAGVHLGTLAALNYARMFSHDITAVHVSIDQEEANSVREKWETWGDGVRLVILESPYRMFIEPILTYIEGIHQECEENEVLTILVPQFIPRHWWSGIMHTRTADTLRRVLLHHPDIVISEVPYQVD